MSTRRIEVRPLTTALGAEVAGVDLSQPLDDQSFATIHDALMAHLVVFFRDQSLMPEQQKAFGRRFGTLGIDRFVEAMPGHPEVLEVIKEAGETYNFGGGWHSDNSFLARPPMLSILHALEVPAYGGDTLYANMYLAYESLSAGMRRLLDGLIAVFWAERAYGREATRKRFPTSRVMKTDQSEVAAEDARIEQEHPAVRTHPVTGRKALYVNAAYTRRFAGMTEAESRPLLDFLYQHARHEAFTCRLRWRAGMLTIWDNRCAQHFALNDYAGARRVMRRIVVEGDRPA